MRVYGPLAEDETIGYLAIGEVLRRNKPKHLDFTSGQAGECSGHWLSLAGAFGR